MMRWTLLVDRVASWSCAADQVASCPLPAVSTMSGLSAKFVRDAACFLEAPPWRYSSMVLRMEAAHGQTPASNCWDRHKMEIGDGQPIGVNGAHTLQHGATHFNIRWLGRRYAD